jgi:hypothetical protein
MRARESGNLDLSGQAVDRPKVFYILDAREQIHPRLENCMAELGMILIG